MNQAFFFDRDGVLNEIVQRDGGHYSPQDFSQFVIIKEAIEFTQYTHSLGFLNIVISNQPDISRGTLLQSDLQDMTNVLYNSLKIDDVFYCVHDDEDMCKCRKPLPGLFLEASYKWNIELTKSYMVGDTWKDIEAAKKVNVDSFLIDTDYNAQYEYPKRVKSLKNISELIGN
tara:strand:- start:229 stop:744 length:516 start_codon:yes stop_codon:yes gene_type:complete